MLRLNKFAVVPITGHYDEDGKLVDEEIGGEATVYTAEQFADLFTKCEAEIERRNAATEGEA